MKCMEIGSNYIDKLLPKRKSDTHKGNYGKILLLCGSRGYTGAAALAAMGALRTGAGLVYLAVPECIYDIEAVKLTEPVVLPLPCDGNTLSVSAIKDIMQLLPKMDAVLLGCGMGCSEGTLAAVTAVLENFDGPVVLDADGINVLKGHMDILRGRSAPTILTPHEGEFRRMGGHPEEGRENSAMAMAKEMGIVLVLKGHQSVITDGEQCYRNPTGNPGMAVGGSGDVLAGVIVSLLGQGLEPMDAAVCGVWLHGAAGDLCAAEIGEYGMLPGDLVNTLPRLLK